MRKFTYLMMLTAAGCSDSNPFPRLASNGGDTPFATQSQDDLIQKSDDNMGSQVVVISDQGLQVPIGQYTLPEGWKCTQDVASDPASGQIARYQVDFYSGQNQLIRMKGTLSYLTILGITFDGLLNKAINEGTKDISQLRAGALALNTKVMNDQEFVKKMQSMMSPGMRFEQLEMPFSGVRNGQAIQGRVDVTHFIMHDYTGAVGGGSLTVRLVMSPPEIFSTTLDLTGQIDRSYKANPQHDRMVAGLMNGVTRQIDANTANNTRMHEQRMGDMQDNFNAHQQRMSGMQQSFDQQNQQWMDNQRNSGGQTVGTDGYGNHEQFIDMINEQTTLSDPSTGYDTRQDGQYQYWYTDGNGHYHGTDDINFDPAVLGKDWQATQPRKPE